MEYFDTAVLWKIGDRIGRTLKVDRATSVGIRGNFARLCVEVDLTKPLLAKFKLRRRIRRIMYEGLHLICFQCGQYGHKQEQCPHVPQAEQEVAKELDSAGVPNNPIPNNPIVRPEIIESFGTWMIAEQRTRRLNKGKGVEPNMAAGKSVDYAKNLGVSAKVIKESQLSVSTRYAALMAREEDNVIAGEITIKEGGNKERGAEDGGSVKKEINKERGSESESNKEKGWPMGHKKAKAGKEKKGSKCEQAQ